MRYSSTSQQITTFILRRCLQPSRSIGKLLWLQAVCCSPQAGSQWLVQASSYEFHNFFCGINTMSWSWSCLWTEGEGGEGATCRLEHPVTEQVLYFTDNLLMPCYSWELKDALTPDITFLLLTHTSNCSVKMV